MRHSSPLLLVGVLVGALLAAASGFAGTPVISIGALSQQVSASKAHAQATISATTPSSPKPASASATSGSSTNSSGSSVAPSYPSLAADAPLLAQPHPLGPQSFWYRSGGYACIYLPGASAACYLIVAAHKSVPPINPVAIAAQAAASLDLAAGALEASPTAALGGLTGAASWFWLHPTPVAQSVTVSLDGEQVSVRAAPAAIDWSFGDGARSQAGPGIAYQQGPTPAGALLHSYGTRCLPGDKGHNPTLLPSCGERGYPIQATISWQLSYQAHGPVNATGTLPARTTSVSASYPVSEARAFLNGGR